jgi:hypothetical protein
MRRLISAISLFALICVIGTGYAADTTANAAPVSTAPVEVPKMIAGKPYSITPGSKPGTYVVKWGDDSFTWEAKPWYEDTLKKQGPAYYAQWTSGKPFPFDVPIDQRDKLDPDDIMDRCIAWSYYGPYYQGEADMWNNLVVEPNGSLRETEHFMEIAMAFVGGTNQEYLPASQRGKVSHIYEWIAIDPEEVRGQSGITTDYFERDQHPQDTWYTPTVRKVRRLAGAVSKQFFPGTIFRYEDVSHVRALPDLNYKIVGFELFKADPSVHGNGPNDYPDVKRVDMAGDVAVVLEITPKPDVSWWYAKRRIKCGLQSLTAMESEEYDEKGAVQRHVVHGLITGSEGKMPDGSPAPDWYQVWGALFVDDKKSGFRGDAWLSQLQFDPGLPTSIFTNDTLVREPRKLGFWK